MRRLLIICWLSLSLSATHAAIAEQKTNGDCNPSIVLNRGRVAVICPQGLPKEIYQQLIDQFDSDSDRQETLAKNLDVTKPTLRNFFKVLQQQEIPLDDLDSKLREIAEHYQKLQERIRSLSGEDPEIARLKLEAQAALEVGAYERAEMLLNEMSAKAIQVAQELQGTSAQQLLVAAQAKAANGDLHNSQLAYEKAAPYYDEASDMLASLDKPLTRAEYLSVEGRTWWQASRYGKASLPDRFYKVF